MRQLKAILRTIKENNSDYRSNNGKIDKNHIVYKAIKDELPSFIKAKVFKKNDPLLDFINIKSSTGNGLIGDSYWIAFLDKRVTKTTTSGIYPVILFDREINYLYLSIASGTENDNMNQIIDQASSRKKKITELIKDNSDFKDFNYDTFYLGESERAKKFAASSSIVKKYDVRKVNQREFKKDFDLLIKLYYDFIFFVEEESKKETSSKRIKRSKIIDVEKHDELRLKRDKRNSEIGKAAEAFVYNYEVEALKKANRSDLAERVDWISSREDGHGYDILSFFENGEKKLIEVKGSIRCRSNFQFYLTENELEVASKNIGNHFIYLVENVEKVSINIFEMIEDIGNFDMVPTVFLCKLR